MPNRLLTTLFGRSAAAADTDDVDEAARRLARRVQPPARPVERQAQAKCLADLHLGDALEHLVRRQQIEPPLLIVGAEVAPVRALRPLRPTFAHGVHSLLCGIIFDMAAKRRAGNYAEICTMVQCGLA